MTATKGLSRRSLDSWIMRAISSLPVPFSPCSRTFTGVLLTRRARSSTSRMAWLSAINRVSIERSLSNRSYSRFIWLEILRISWLMIMFSMERAR